MNNYQDNQELINGFIPITIKNLSDTSQNYDGTTPDKNPAFYGCGDWHSSVHSHWQVIRAIRLFPQAAFVEDAVKILNDHITAVNIEKESKHVPNSEVPYGVAWVLLLAQELREWKENPTNTMPPETIPRWLSAIKPLETYAREKLANYMQPKVAQYPNRGGDHYQTALPLALAWDWAQVSGDDQLSSQIQKYCRNNYQKDIEKPEEPKDNQSYKFLSPSLAEADLLRRVLEPDEFEDWLNGSYFFKSIQDKGTYAFIEPPRNYLLSHIYGLNISRAFMAKGIASALKDAYRTQVLNIANKIYQFAFNGSSYEYGHNSIPEITLVDAPADADASSFAMLHDGSNYRLYLRQLGEPNQLYQFAWVSGTTNYKWGHNSIPKIPVTGFPNNSDTNRWAMLHDGAYRFYRMELGNNNKLQQASFNGSSYQYGHNSIPELTLVDTPADSDLSGAAMLHDGGNYRFYLLKQ